jgi:uncharacterized protein YjiK
MTKWPWLVLCLAVAGPATGCNYRADKARAEAAALEAREKRLEARLARAEQTQSAGQAVAMWIMPPALSEISGIALTGDGRLLAHDDELARVFEIDPKRGVILKSFMLGKGLHGDFEGITVVGQDLYMMLSNGLLYRFREGENQSRVDYTTFDTHLGKECEFEGVAYEKDSARLLLPCKHVKLKHLDDQVVIYKWKIGSRDSTGITMLTVPLGEVIGDNKWKKFRPSDITVDPATGNYVLISSLEKGLVVMTPAGDVIRSERLPGKHAQAEGVAITSDNILIISDEATSKPASITLYKWNRPDREGITQ